MGLTVGYGKRSVIFSVMDVMVVFRKVARTDNRIIKLKLILIKVLANLWEIVLGLLPFVVHIIYCVCTMCHVPKISVFNIPSVISP